MSDKVGLLLEVEQLRRERDEWEALAIDRGIALKEARDVARGLLALLEGYLRLDVAAPKRIRDEAAAARAKIEGWEKG